MRRKWMNDTESFRNCFKGNITRYYKFVAELHWTGNNREEGRSRIRVYVPSVVVNKAIRHQSILLIERQYQSILTTLVNNA